jgi:hypothetical protein
MSWAQSAEIKPIAALVQQQKDRKAIFQPITQLWQAYEDAALSKSVGNAVQKSTLLKLDLNQLAQLSQSAPATMALTLPAETGNLTVELVKINHLTTDFTVMTNQPAAKTIDYQQGSYYRGIVKGDENSIVAMSFFNDEVYGMISNQNGNFVLGRIEQPNNKMAYIFYNDKDLTKKPDFNCGTEEPNDLKIAEQPQPKAVTGCVRVYLEADYALFANKGSVQNTVNYLTAMYNNVALLYQNEQISTVISQIYVWTTPDAYSTTSSSNALTAFQTARPNANGDLAHLIALGGNNNIGGIAYVNILCNNAAKYAYSNIYSSYNNVPTYSWTIMVVAHEMGHNLGSPHTQACGWIGGALDNCYATEGGCPQGPAPTNGGTIMSYCHLTGYGINLSNGFGVQPGNLIRSKVSTATCLPASCNTALPCPAPTNLTFNTLTVNSANLNWTAAANAISYVVEYKLATATIWMQIAVNGTNYTLSNLQSNATYNVRIKTVCIATSSTLYSNVVTFTTLVNCLAPTNLQATNTTATSTVLSWAAAANATGYVVEYKLSTATSWSTLTVANTPYVLNNLQPNTFYNIRIKTNCNITQSVAYSNEITVLTSVVCGSAITGMTYNATSNSATISWNAVSGATAYQVDYKLSTATTWIMGVTTSNNYVISGLASNKTYQVRVRTLCSNGILSPYSTFTVTTLAAVVCNVPTGLSANNVSATSATISWNAVSGATGYSLELATASNTTAWTIVTTSNTTYNWTNLQPNMAYLIRIKTICSNSAVSAYSSTVNFNTSSSNGCNMPTGLTANNVTGTTAFVTWNTVGGAINYSLDYAAVNNPNYWITSTPNTNSFTLYNLQRNTQYQMRIKTVCGGGAASGYTANVFFTTTSALIAGAPQNSIDIAPNPTTGVFKILFSLKEWSDVDIALTDVTGKLLYSEKISLLNGSHDMDIESLPSGVYFVKAVVNQKELLVKKVIK